MTNMTVWWNKFLKDKNKGYVVAEAGVNHLGSLELGERLIRAAKEAGADAIKFQSYKASNLCTKDAPRFWDWEGEVKKDGSQFDSYSLLDSFGKNEHLGLKKICDKYQIEFLSTPFDMEAADYLNEIGVNLFKIASCDITNHYFLDHVARKGKPIFLATGAADLEEIKEAVGVIELAGNRQIVVMHCNLCYPTNDQDANLKMIKHLKKEFPSYSIGLSDHTMNLMAPAVGFVLGARVFEKHFTVDKTLDKSADHWLSADPKDLQEIVENIAAVKSLMGQYKKRSTASEVLARQNARRSIAATRDIKAGEVLSVKNISCKRPGTGISAKYFKDVLGKTVKADIANDTLIKADVIEEFEI